MGMFIHIDVNDAALSPPVRAALVGVCPVNIFMIEGEYDEAMRAAEINWLRKTIGEIQSGAYPWPSIVNGQLEWDGDETFQVLNMALDEWAELAMTKEAEGKAKKPDRAKK